MSYIDDPRSEPLKKAIKALSRLQFQASTWIYTRIENDPRYEMSSEYRDRDAPLRDAVLEMLRNLEQMKLWMD